MRAGSSRNDQPVWVESCADVGLDYIFGSTLDPPILEGVQAVQVVLQSGSKSDQAVPPVVQGGTGMPPVTLPVPRCPLVSTTSCEDFPFEYHRYRLYHPGENGSRFKL